MISKYVYPDDIYLMLFFWSLLWFWRIQVSARAYACAINIKRSIVQIIFLSLLRSFTAWCLSNPGSIYISKNDIGREWTTYNCNKRTSLCGKIDFKVKKSIRGGYHLSAHGDDMDIEPVELTQDVKNRMVELIKALGLDMVALILL